MTARNLRNIHKNHNNRVRYDRLTERAYYSGGYTGTQEGTIPVVVDEGYWIPMRKLEKFGHEFLEALNRGRDVS